jgi:DNA repair protein RadC
MWPADQPPMQIRTARDAADFLAPAFAGARRELLAILFIDSNRLVVGRSETRQGEQAAIDLPLRPILADALRFDAAGLILAHNHPSGDPTPSDADVAATRKLARIAGELGVQVHDHLIFAGGSCRSFRAMGFL